MIEIGKIYPTKMSDGVYFEVIKLGTLNEKTGHQMTYGNYVTHNGIKKYPYLPECPLSIERLVVPKEHASRKLNHLKKVKEVMDAGGIAVNENVLKYILATVDRIENNEELNPIDIKNEI